VDAESRPDVLTLADRGGRPATRGWLLVAGLLAFAGCGGNAPVVPPDLPAVGGQGTLLRVPRRGGIVEAYRADSLGQPIWTSREPVPAVKDLLGVNLDARLLYAIDAKGNLVAIDLEARGVRQQAKALLAGIFVPDGAVYAFDKDRRVTRYDVGTPTIYRDSIPAKLRFRYGTLGDRLILVTDAKPPRLLVLSDEHELHSEPVADGEPVSTYWGDLVAIPSGHSVVLYQTEDPWSKFTIDVGGEAKHVAFSPSGHQLYVARGDGRIVVIDRFGREPVGEITLPGLPTAIRTDASGRWMVARSASGDSAWVVDLATNRVTASVETGWADDLPTVAGAATLLARVDGDLVASDLSQPKIPETGRFSDGADDLWLVSAWLPRDRARVAAEAAESVLVAQDSALAPDTTSSPTPVDQLYLQVSSSQNPAWSREFAKQLSGAGYPARVLEPTTVDDGYRVVVGPYATRAEAEEVGRKLGRPYFILTNPPKRP
jgi:SPOR domain